MVDDLKEYADTCQAYEEAFEKERQKYTYAQPFTKESLYREIFEKYYPGQAEMIAGLDAESGVEAVM